MLGKLVGKFFRTLSTFNFKLRSALRCKLIRLKYSSCTIGRDVKIGRNVQFSVTDGGSVCIGDGTAIKDNCVIVAKRGSLVIGKNSFIGWGSIICANQEISIGDDCLIAEFVTIRDQNHGTSLDDGPFRQQPMKISPINIGDNVWIGAKASVLAGCSIAANSIVAAHCVVNKDVESRVIVGGIPASIIKPLS